MKQCYTQSRISCHDEAGAKGWESDNDQDVQGSALKLWSLENITGEATNH